MDQCIFESFSNVLVRENVNEEVILATLDAALSTYARERGGGERFEDLCIRTGVAREVREGNQFNA